jgi:hypothetical protein
MPITATCPNCGQPAKAPDSAAGKAVRCPACKERFSLPAQGIANRLPAQAPTRPIPAPARGSGSPPPVDVELVPVAAVDGSPAPKHRRGLLWPIVCSVLGALVIAIGTVGWMARPPASRRDDGQGGAGLKIPDAKPWTREQKDAAGGVVRALGKVEAALEVGVNFRAYGDLVIAAKAEFNEADGVIPNDERGEAIRDAMRAFADAVAVWGEEIQASEYSPGLSDESARWSRIISRYSLKQNKRGAVGYHYARQTIWLHAGKSLAKARSLAK